MQDLIIPLQGQMKIAALTQDVSNGVLGTSSSEVCFEDNRDGTITHINTGLMWTKEDSYAVLDNGLNWNDSKTYVNRLNTSAYNDWRMPTVKELKTIYDMSKSSNIAYDHRSIFPLHIDSIFTDGAAYWYWSSERSGPCCARAVLFSNSVVFETYLDFCSGIGVRAVRRGL